MHRVFLFVASYAIRFDFALYSQDNNRYPICSCTRCIAVSQKFLLICIL